MGYQALLFCPDDKAARGVTQVLSELDFTVETCTEPFAAVKKLMAQHFDAVVVDCDNEQNATLLFKSARNSASNQTSLAVAVVEGQAGVAKAFRIGANLVLTKPINVEQAKGTLRVARGLLRKGTDGPKTTGDAATPVAASAPAIPAAAAPKPATSAARVAPAATIAAPASVAPSAKAWPAPQKSAVSPRAPQAEIPRADAPVASADVHSKPTAPKADFPKAAKPAAPAQPSAAQTKYPWQAAKPGAEPMASALKKAAEVAGIAPQPAPPVEKAHEAFPAAPSLVSGSAAAPAPAKEKLPVAAPPSVPVIETPADPEAEKTEIAFSSAAANTASNEHAAPSFSIGAPAVEEEEAPNSKKALIILAIVVILASMAGYLAWKNMSDKSPAKAPASQIQAPATSSVQPSPVAPAPAVNETVASASPAASNAVSAPSEPSAPSPSMAKPSPKIIAKDSTKSLPATSAPTSTEASSPEPAQPALVVHNETSRPAPKAAPADTESAPSASALGLTPNSDSSALSAIGNAPASVPKASNQVIRVSQGVSEGLILKKVAPRYPAQALQMRLEGSVQMQATVAKDGSISNVKVLSGDALLARSAVEAVKQWKYKPYYLDGEPVDIQTQITINFKLPR